MSCHNSHCDSGFLWNDMHPYNVCCLQSLCRWNNNQITGIHYIWFILFLFVWWYEILEIHTPISSQSWLYTCRHPENPFITCSTWLMWSFSSFRWLQFTYCCDVYGKALSSLQPQQHSWNICLVGFCWFGCMGIWRVVC